MALKMKNVHKYDKATKLFQHALALQPLHPDVLNNYGEFLEEKENDVLKADHLYVRALTVSPEHSRALVNRKRTLPVVKELDEQELERIDKKRIKLIKMNHKDPALKRIKKEIYFQHIYHTVAIEGNTMTLAEARSVVETRMAVPGKSIMEHNEILGLESALRYINKTLVNKDELITVVDILEIHKRVLGNVDPLGAGTFRQNQVFVGEHVPPLASDVADLMEEFVNWLQSETILQLHPVNQAALAHYKLVYIHPFVDGNGRTARLLMNLILMRAGYPPVIIRKQDRARYYKYLQLANEGDIRPFLRFIAHCTECTLDVFLYANEYGTECLKALESRFKEKNDIIPL
ncbi:protein adenylyltransferase Fic-like [Uloborus diversus]|uniref:protein adenylyltransferase Fic-like n=1 Tax=Uloborus diversus TaxID=327109 RepID=UPI00240A303B|nr:protein adenylyltransferase Fic-like [Uloborus diversus]